VTTVPVCAASVLLHDRPDLLAGLAGAQVMLGQRPEIDLGRVGDQVLAQALGAYWADTVGSSAPRPFGHRWLIAAHAQKSGPGLKADLGAQFQAMADMPVLGDLVQAATEACVDLDVLVPLARMLSGSVTSGPGANPATIISVELVPGGLDDALGGAPWPNESGRVLDVTVRHAPWRDRRVRRLVGVDVYAQGHWPDPQGYLTLLGADIVGASR